MKLTKSTFAAALCLTFLPTHAAGQPLSLEECRQMAVMNNKDLKIAEEKVRIAGYDRKTALANYFPDISATAGYMYNSHSLSLISEENSKALSQAGTSLQSGLQDKLLSILSDPSIGQAIAGSPQLQLLIQQLQGTDIATPINRIGDEIGKSFQLDIASWHAKRSHSRL